MRLVTIKKYERILRCYEKIRSEYELVKLNKTLVILKHKKCGNLTTKSHTQFLNSPRCNTPECIQEYKKQLSVEKYGIDNPGKLDRVKNKRRKTNLKKFGVDNPNKLKEVIDKRKKTNLQKYGKEFYIQTEEFKEKSKKTNLEKYGTEWYLQSDLGKKKVKETLLLKYGIDNISLLQETINKIKKTKLVKHGSANYCNTSLIKKTKLKRYNNATFNNKNKSKKTCLKKYGAENVMQVDDIKNRHFQNKKKLRYKFFKRLSYLEPLFTEEEYINSKSKYYWKCKKCNSVFEDYYHNGNPPRCVKCYPVKSNRSKIEDDICTWLRSKINFVTNKKFYFNGNKNSYEIDIYFPEQKIGIELNGIYWHSENSGKKTKEYHLNKTKFFNKKDIQVIHIWDIEWINKTDIVKSLLLAKLNLITTKIYGRKTKIVEVSNKVATDFYTYNHLQSGINSSINLALVYEDKIVSMVSFSKSRFNKKYEYEMTRFSNRINTIVIGGFSKLLNYFTLNYSSSLITYADLRYSTGQVYYRNNFKLIDQSSPNYFYTRDYKHLESRIKYQKHKLKRLLENFDESLTEWENMQLNSYDRVWDCGNLVFSYG